MLQNTSENGSSKLSLPMGRIRVPKFLIMIVVVLIALIGGVVWLNVYLSNLKKPKNLDLPTNTTTESEISSAEISKKIISWVEKQRDSRGVYTENEICNNGVCVGSASSNRSGFGVLAGKVRYDGKFDKSIEEDLMKYLDRKSVEIIQSNYLACNFLYDLYSYPGASQEVKDLSKKLCFDIGYEIADSKDSGKIYGYENVDDKDGLVKHNLIRQNVMDLDKYLTNVTNKGVVDNNFEITKRYGYYVSEFLTRYDWEHKTQDIRGFSATLSKFLDLYSKNKDKFNDGEVCSVAGSLIAIGNIDDEPTFLKYGDSLYGEQISEKDFDQMSLNQLLNCGIVADKISDATTLTSIIKTIIANYYDSEKGCVGQQAKIAGDKILLNTYDVKNNGTFLFLLNSKVGKKL